MRSPSRPLRSARKFSLGWIRALLRWFARARRDLPWRRHSDPYRVWVSEIMLQQTPVRTALPYYERFLARFPTLTRLARARLQTVLRAWEGLGYYARARNLHRAARQIVKQYCGVFPRTAAELRRLPGVGEYTAAAVASICFGECVPAIDGNAFRVLSRLFGVEGDARHAKDRRKIATHVRALMPSDGPGDFNQAIMELGATICTPRNPGCVRCPLRSGCAAHNAYRTHLFPTRSRRPQLPHYDVVACVIRRGDRFLVARRRPDQMLGGLWEFPGGKCRPGESLMEAAQREIAEETGLKVKPLECPTAIEHAYSHFRITLHAVVCQPIGGRARPRECDAIRWVRARDLARLPFPSADRKIMRRLGLLVTGPDRKGKQLSEPSRAHPGHGVAKARTSRRSSP